ncbi:MAG: ABC transporter permease [Proteobacteria bacterium]|nr:ABC transporter permease [Pseudomonadota bacterium]
MTSARFYAIEAWHELREGLRGPLVPLMLAGLIGYVFVMLVNAEWLRDMGGADVPRNSHILVFQLTSGQTFWLIFAWAWVFAQVVTRDRVARLHELVLCAPVSLPGLIVARYVGALGIACILGASSSIALLLVPALSAIGMISPALVGPTPFLGIAWAWLLFVLPSAIGLGALYVVAALQTRSTAGPFAASAVVILVWMAAMVILRAGDFGADIATLIDVSGFGEAQAQTERWTPHEKVTAQLALTKPLLLNRLLWTAIPLAAFAIALRRQRRETLVLERTAETRGASRFRRREKSVEPAALASSVVRASRLPAWLITVYCEARWHLAQTLKGWAFRLSLGLFIAIGVAGTFVHMIAHADGPLVPRAQILAPFLVELTYMFSVFAVAGFVGALARRDARPGFDELVDATPVPLGVRVIGRAMAALALTLALALTPTLTAWIVVLLAVPASFEPWNALLFNALVVAPALLELAALTFLTHSLVRSAGLAYVLSMLLVFVAVVNHEIDVVAYPPAQIGIAVHVALGELTGFSPWIAPVLVMGSLKLACVGLAVALAWFVYPRGTALTVLGRVRAGLGRTRRAGVVAGVSLSVIVLCAIVLHERIVVQGGFAPRSQQDASDAAWEKRFWHDASEFSVQGGQVEAEIDPVEGVARVNLTVHGVRASGSQLHGSLPIGMRVERARVNGRVLPVIAAHDHVAIDLGDCGVSGCDVHLDIVATGSGWLASDAPPWLHSSGVWARATDLLPRLGHDAERALRSPGVRSSLGLPEKPRTLGSRAVVPAHAVAPAGAWRWSVAITEAGKHTALQGTTDRGLDFAVAWLPDDSGLVELKGEVIVWHGPARTDTARDVAADVGEMRACIEARLGSSPDVATVLQAPRELGEVAVHGRMLWIPEHEGWDVDSHGVGRFLRRAAIAEALAKRWLADRADLRAEPGVRWLTDGVAGWLGLECVRFADGTDAWLSLLDRRSERVADSFGALDAPVVGLANDGAAQWVETYAAQATLGWAQTVGTDQALEALTSIVDRIRAGFDVRGALVQTLGRDTAELLLDAPWYSDFRVALADRGELDQTGLKVLGKRFQWKGSGWQAVDTHLGAVQRFHDESTQFYQRIPARLNREKPFVVFDAWPSFERSPGDNAWPGLARDGKASNQDSPR